MGQASRMEDMFQKGRLCSGRGHTDSILLLKGLHTRKSISALAGQHKMTLHKS